MRCQGGADLRHNLKGGGRVSHDPDIETCNLLLNELDTLVGAVGIEPTTFGLKGRCSTTELRP